MADTTREPAARPATDRRGSILIIVAVSVVVLLTFAALAIDFTFLMYERQRAQNAVDSAAHAALVAYTAGEGDEVEMELLARAMLDRHGYEDALVEIGAYDFESRDFESGTLRTNAVRVAIEAEDTLQGDLFLAPRLNLPLSARGGDIEAVSAIQPREIYFVLDQSCSMSSGAKVASMTQGTLLALDAVLDTDPNGVDHVALVGFGDAGFLHTPLTNVSDNYSSLRNDWGDGICLCSLDPYVKYYAYYRGHDPNTAEAYNTVTGHIHTNESALHPLQLGDAHYGTEGSVDLNFRCCEPHCNASLESTRPNPNQSNFWTWLNTYGHGNGVLWGLQVASEEIEDAGLPGAYRMVIVLGDGIDFCPSGSNGAAMPAPCSTGGDLLGETVDFAGDMREDQNVHIFPVYYGSSSSTLSYYEDLATGDGIVSNPSTPEELESVFAEIVWRSQVVLVPR
mgnify:FL=1